MNPKFRCRKNEQGDIEYADREGYYKFIKSMKIYKPYDLIFEPCTKKISDPMRRYYFGVVMVLIKDASGDNRPYVKDILHEEMKNMFGPKREIVSPVTGKTILVNESVFGNKSSVPVGKKKEFVTAVKMWAEEFFGIYIPDPKEVSV